MCFSFSTGSAQLDGAHNSFLISTGGAFKNAELVIIRQLSLSWRLLRTLETTQQVLPQSLLPAPQSHAILCLPREPIASMPKCTNRDRADCKRFVILIVDCYLSKHHRRGPSPFPLLKLIRSCIAGRTMAGDLFCEYQPQKVS